MTARSRGAGASLLTTLTLATLAPVAAAHVLPRPHPGHLSLDERAVYQRAVIRHDENVLRWLRRHPSRQRTLSALGLAKAAVSRDRVWRFHRAQAIWERRELVETLAAIEAQQERRSWSYAGRSWLVAVELADRIFPGTGGWLRSCSAPTSEGGWDGWVPNRHGSGAGGWLQFMPGTFYEYVDRAFAEALSRGTAIPARYRSWHSTIGQAVTGAWMLLDGQRGQWAGGGC